MNENQSLGLYKSGFEDERFANCYSMKEKSLSFMIEYHAKVWRRTGDNRKFSELKSAFPALNYCKTKRTVYRYEMASRPCSKKTEITPCDKRLFFFVSSFTLGFCIYCYTGCMVWFFAVLKKNLGLGS